MRISLRKNWLVQEIHDVALQDALRTHASGKLLDVGCGKKPYEDMTKGLVSEHIGLDYPGTLHLADRIDVFGTAYETGFGDGTVDTVLCTVVLEHLEDPLRAFREFRRVIKPGGKLVLSAPLFWHLHEEPRDFYRYTRYGLNYMLEESGFRAIQILPLSGFVVTFTQELCYYIERFRRGPLIYPVVIAQQTMQQIAYYANRIDKTTEFTWCYLVVGEAID